MWSLLRGVVVACALFVCLNSVGEAQGVKSERIVEKARRHAKLKRWNKVEDWLVALESSRKVTSTGRLQSDYVHIGASANSVLSKSQSDEEWEEWYQSIEAWGRESARQDIVASFKLDFWTAYAWKGRTNKFAREVTKEQWLLFRERLEEAEKVYNETVTRGCEYAWFYSEAMSLALGQGWSNKRTYDELYQKAVKLDPESQEVYYYFVNRLQPKWYGEGHDDYHFMRGILDDVPGELGEEIYARVLTHDKLHEIVNYQYDLVDYEALKSGARSIMKKYPSDITFMERYMSFCLRYGDLEESVRGIREVSATAYELFTQRSPYGRALGLGDEYPGTAQRLNYFKPQGNLGVDGIQGAVWLAGGEEYVVCAENRGVQKFAANGQDVLERFMISGRSMKHLALCPQRRFLAVVTSYDTMKQNEQSLVYVFDMKEGRFDLLKTIWVPARNSTSICFSADGETLFYSHVLLSKYRKNTESHLNGISYCHWREENARFEVVLEDEGPDGMGKLKVSPDGRYLYFYWTGLWRFDLANLQYGKAEQVISPKGNPYGYVWDYGFLEGGENLIVIRNSAKRGQSLTVHDAQSWKMLAHKPLKEFIGTFRALAVHPEENAFYMTGEAALAAGYSYDPDKKHIALQSVWSGNGQEGDSISVSPKVHGGYRVTAGTENGMIGNWELE
jgi:hypothetical protein